MNLMSGPRWVWAQVKRLRAIVQDDDHDAWLDDHQNGPKKGPDTGKIIRGGGIGGGG